MSDGLSEIAYEEDRAAVRALLNSKHHSSADLYHAGIAYLDRLENAYSQACTNLATIRPSGDGSLGEDAQAWKAALYAGKAAPW